MMDIRLNISREVDPEIYDELLKLPKKLRGERIKRMLLIALVASKGGSVSMISGNQADRSIETPNEAAVEIREEAEKIDIEKRERNKKEHEEEMKKQEEERKQKEDLERRKKLKASIVLE